MRIVSRLRFELVDGDCLGRLVRRKVIEDDEPKIFIKDLFLNLLIRSLLRSVLREHPFEGS